MRTILKRQIDEMTDEELKEVFRREYLRRLTRYRMTEVHLRKK